MNILKTYNRKDLFYITLAIAISKFSHAKRKKVGGIVVKNDQIIAEGYNGTPSGWDNKCEINDVTKKEVLHAESNLITKLAKSSMGSENSKMYLTLSPCFDCAKLIYQAGIKEVIFVEVYRNINGLEFLDKCNVVLRQIDEIELKKNREVYIYE